MNCCNKVATDKSTWHTKLSRIKRKFTAACNQSLATEQSKLHTTILKYKQTVCSNLPPNTGLRSINNIQTIQ
jgi:hypothetical protein